MSDQHANTVFTDYRNRLIAKLPDGATVDGKRESEFTADGITVRFHLYGYFGRETLAYGSGETWDAALACALEDLGERRAKAARVLATV